METKNDIVHDSYYLINLFANDKKRVTQLQVQKLMYFFEAFYMNLKDVDSLYECPFKAWAFGPVAIPLYKRYKNLGDSDIVLTSEEQKIGNSINNEKKKILEEIYNVFGQRLTAMQLVNYTHLKDSPWDKKWNENSKKVIYGDKSNIDKLETKKWFKEIFLKSDE